MKRNCDYFNNEYNADTRNLKRGWCLCCSKSCTSSKSEEARLGYCPKKVYENNITRELVKMGKPTGLKNSIIKGIKI